MRKTLINMNNPLEQARGDLAQRMNVLWDEADFSWEVKKKLLADPCAFNLIDYLEIFDPDFDLNDFITSFCIDKALETLAKLKRDPNSDIEKMPVTFVPHLGPDTKPLFTEWRHVIGLAKSAFGDWSPHWTLSQLTQRLRDWRRGFSDRPAKEERGKRIR